MAKVCRKQWKVMCLRILPVIAQTVCFHHVVANKRELVVKMVVDVHFLQLKLCSHIDILHSQTYLKGSIVFELCDI